MSASSPSFDVIVTNRGDATARNIKVLDRFDPGLSHVRASTTSSPSSTKACAISPGGIGNGGAHVWRPRGWPTVS